MKKEFKIDEFINNGETIVKSFTLDNCTKINNIQNLYTIETLDDFIEVYISYKINDYPTTELLELNQQVIARLNFTQASTVVINLEFKKYGDIEFLLHKTVFDLIIETEIIVDESKPSNEFIQHTNNIFNPYQLPALNNIKNSFNTIINKTYGHCVQYWRSIPDMEDHIDVIFKEYTLYNVQNYKELKVIIPENQVPEDNFEYQLMDMEFMEMPFEIQIHKDEWNCIFGSDTTPSKGDILYLTLLNRMYKVNGLYTSQIERFDTEGYYRLNLIKWEDEISHNMEDDVRDEISELTKSYDDVFGLERGKELKTATKPNQLTINSTGNDEYRNYIHPKLNIISFDLINDWNVLSNYIYDMSSIPPDETGVTYKNTIDIGNFTNIIFWIKMKEGYSGKQTILKSELFEVYITNGILFYKINSNIYEFSFMFDDATWYGINLNISNIYSISVLNVFKNNANKLLNNNGSVLTPITSLNVVNSKETANEQTFSLIGGEYDITFIRVFNSYIEDLGNIMEQTVVQANNNLIIYDNATQPLKLNKQSFKN